VLDRVAHRRVITMAKFDPKLTESIERPPIVVPGNLACSPMIEQTTPQPPPWFSGKPQPMPVYDNSRGVMPTGYPTPTSPINPQPAKPPNRR
jgi:hypothetical protein